MSKSIHLFYISNYLSFNNYLTLIEEKKIRLEQCIFYSPRLSFNDLNMAIDLKIVTVSKFNLSRSRRDLFKNLKIIKHAQSEINKIVQYKPFTFYIPHLINDRERLILINKNCINYFFVEEGFPAYRVDYQKKEFFKVIQPNYWNIINLPPLAIIKNKYRGCYGNYDYSFHWMPTKSLIPIKFNHDCKIQTDNLIPNNSHVLGVDSPKKFNNFNNYIATLEELFLGLKKKQIKNIHIKFHPDFNHFTAEKELVVNFLSKYSIKIHVLNSNFYLEELFKYNNEITFYSTLSSLIIYAIKENIKVIHLKINDQNMDKQTNKLIGTFDDTLTAMELDFN